MIVLTGSKSAPPRGYVSYRVVPRSMPLPAYKDVEKEEVVMDSRKEAKKKKNLLCISTCTKCEYYYCIHVARLVCITVVGSVV